MSADRAIPPRHPGEILRRKVEHDLEIAQDKLAEALGVSRFSVNQVLNGRRAITPKMALRLERVFGTTPDFWLKLQMRYDLDAARRELGAQLDALPQLVRPAAAPPA